MVSHKNVGVYLAVILLCDLPQDGEIKPPVFIISKTNGTVNATLDEVLRDTCYIDSRMPNNSNAPEMTLVFESICQEAASRCRLLLMIRAGNGPDPIYRVLR